GSEVRPDAARGEAVAAVVERVGMLEGDRVVAIELASPGERDRRGAEPDRRTHAKGAAQPARQVAVAVLVAVAVEAVDARRALPSDTAREAHCIGAQRTRGAAAQEAERAGLG